MSPMVDKPDRCNTTSVIVTLDSGVWSEFMGAFSIYLFIYLFIMKFVLKVQYKNTV